MKHLNKYNKFGIKINEEIGNPKLLNFYNEYKELLETDVDYDNSELYDMIGELCLKHKMTKGEVNDILKNMNTSFDIDKMLQSTCDHWIENDSNKSYTISNYQLSDLLDKVGTKIRSELGTEGRSTKGTSLSNSVKDTINNYLKKNC